VENEAGVSVDIIMSGSYKIEVASQRYPAKASLHPMYDPKGIKVRS
jgi:4-methylaminobutanoate oxidase (formaldehyde-forming)